LHANIQASRQVQIHTHTHARTHTHAKIQPVVNKNMHAECHTLNRLAERNSSHMESLLNRETYTCTHTHTQTKTRTYPHIQLTVTIHSQLHNPISTHTRPFSSRDCLSLSVNQSFSLPLTDVRSCCVSLVVCWWTTRVTRVVQSDRRAVTDY